MATHRLNPAKRSAILTLVTAAAIAFAACGEEPPVGQQSVSSVAQVPTPVTESSEVDVTETTPPPLADDWSDGIPSLLIDWLPVTFEQVVNNSPLAVVVEVEDVDDRVWWNTESGDLGTRSDWEGAATVPYGWYRLTVRLVETVKGSPPVGVGETFEVVHEGLAPDVFLPPDPSFVGADALMSLYPRSEQNRDGSWAELLWIDPPGTYAARENGPAVRLASGVFEDMSIVTWRDAGGLDQPVPAESTVFVVRSLDEVIERARNASRPLEEHLGFELLEEGSE